MATHTTRLPVQNYPGDKTDLTRLLREQAALHLQLVRSRATPALLREIASVEARLNRGA